MRYRTVAVAALMLLGGHLAGVRAQQAPFRTLTTTYTAAHYASAADWNTRAAYLREHILATAGLLPMPERSDLHPVVFGDVKHDGYSVSKVFFESLPGFLVTGNLYRPVGPGPFPAILSPHGHWPYGRLENTPVVSAPARAINLARQGFVVFTYDMIGYNDSRQLTHTFGGQRENLWGLSLAGLQLWDSIRSVDFLETLPYVRRDAIGATGESGGGTQTFLLAAVDSRIAVAAPVNMISFRMQGGCLCENQPGLRLDTNNVEIASTIAPRPLLMISATGDWTSHTLEEEYPAVRSIYALTGAADRVHAVRVDAEHNYNRESREAMYAWMARWLQGAPADSRRPERAFTPDPPNDLLVFHGRALPANALSAADLTTQWIQSATRQLATADPRVLGSVLRHVLGFGDSARPVASSATGGAKTVLLSAPDPSLEARLRKGGFSPVAIPFSRFDAAAAAQVPHFETYNRTAASQRVADIVTALRAHPGAALVASGDAALAGLLAAAVTPVRLAVLDVGSFDPSSDADYLAHLYIPGLRRAGGLQTAATVAGKALLIHNAAGRFSLDGVRVQPARLGADEIVAALRAGVR
jgi:hypothetical protein